MLRVGICILAYCDCTMRAAPWELGGKAAVRDAECEESHAKFANYQETVKLSQIKSVPKRGLVSPGCDKQEASLGEAVGRRVRFQPRMRDGNASGAPTLQSGGASVFTVGREPSDECGICLLYTSPSPRDRTRSRMPSSA